MTRSDVGLKAYFGSHAFGDFVFEPLVDDKTDCVIEAFVRRMGRKRMQPDSFLMGVLRMDSLRKQKG